MKHAKSLALTAAALVAGAAATLLSTSVGNAAAPQPAALPAVHAPAALEVPAGNKLTAVFSARGVQTYTCTDGAWKFLEPGAVLSGRAHRPVALHSRGPVWVSTVDGSAVNASSVASSPKDGTIPELLLKATATRGTGGVRGRHLRPAPQHDGRRGSDRRLHRYGAGGGAVHRDLRVLQGRELRLG
jgi:hypothetical protein